MNSYPLDFSIRAPVSVIIPCYKCAKTIKRAVFSVLNQTHVPKEIIFIEDASDDETLSLLQELKESYPDIIKLIIQDENRGVSDARNAGWDAATQPYIAFLDADDAWHPRKIEIQLGFMMENPDISMSGHAHRILSADGELPSWDIERWAVKKISKPEILISNRFVTPSVMIKAGVPFRFAHGKRHMEDHLLWSEIICSGLKAVKISASLAAIYKFSYGIAGLSSQTQQMRRGEIHNYQVLHDHGQINFLVMLIFISISVIKFIRRQLVIGFIKLLSDTPHNIFSYMTLTYSISGLLVILGIFGKHEMAADVAIVQGSVLATFYALSGDARHLILADKANAHKVLFFRLVWIIPLAAISYFMSFNIGHVGMGLASSLILRRVSEWLAEVHVTEIERTGSRWLGLFFQPIFFITLVTQILLFDSYSMIWVWSISPIFFSLKFLTRPKYYLPNFYGDPYVASTSIMGISNYVLRLLVVALAGKVVSGMIFSAVTIGSFTGTMFANVAGPSLIRNNIFKTKILTISIVIWSLLGLALFITAKSMFQQTLGMSMMGGGIMIYAQHSRLILLKSNHTLGADMMLHLSLVCFTPIIYYALGSRWLCSIYLVNAILAWIFYKGSNTMLYMSEVWKKRILAILVLFIIFPIFFQLKGQIYSDTTALGMVDSEGKLNLVPLPFSIIACYLGLILFNEDFKHAKPAVLMICSMFLLLILSILLTGHETIKLLMLVQFMLPTMALLLGISVANIDRKLIAKVFLYFLMFFLPFQLISTWIQGNLALTHILYLFSVYQHYQYVPLIFASLFVWAYVELIETHKLQLYLLAPWMGIYVAAGNSELALFGLVLFAFIYSIKNRKSAQFYFLPLIISASIFGYFYLNTQIATQLKEYNNYHGLYVNKFFTKQGKFLLLEPKGLIASSTLTSIDEVPVESSNGQSSNPNLPINVTSRLNIATRYIKGIMESPMTILFGHPHPPPRTEVSSGHNYYLDITYNFGFLSFIPLILLLIYTIVEYFRVRDLDSAFLWFLSILIYLVILDSNLKVTLRQPYPGIATFFLWGMFLSLLKSKSKK